MEKEFYQVTNYLPKEELTEIYERLQREGCGPIWQQRGNIFAIFRMMDMSNMLDRSTFMKRYMSYKKQARYGK